MADPGGGARKNRLGGSPLSTKSHDTLKVLISDVCRLIDRTREIAADRAAAEAMSARMQKASACVELALATLDGKADRAGGSREAARSEHRATALMGRRASDVSGARGTDDQTPAAERTGGFVGSSTVIPVPELLSFLRAQKKTGLLRVELAAEVIHLHLREGDLAHAFSDGTRPGRRLGEILVEQGAVDAWLLEKVLAEADHDRSEIARVAQLATDEQLRAARAVQIQRMFNRLFEAQEALFSFQEGEQIATRGGGRMDLIRLLLESARFQDERESDLPVADPTWSPRLSSPEDLGGWLLGGEG